MLRAAAGDTALPLVEIGDPAALYRRPGTLFAARFFCELNEIPGDPALAEGAHPGGAVELVGRFPGWAKLMLRLYQAYQDRNQAVLALADRMIVVHAGVLREVPCDREAVGRAMVGA